ncbi:hypothetical protein CRUP_033652 [Coryphaenoides rupestris]|nr:hypothetical protein CRUP_033652 [Coryphaenoides rupestris]
MVEEEEVKELEVEGFLQMENDVVREQVVECEGMFQANLQGLRERNIQCEDLKAALCRLQLEKAAVEAELEASQLVAAGSQRSLGEQLLQGVTVVTLEIHKLRELTSSLHAAPGDPELRQVLQRLQAESRALRDELHRAGPSSSGSTAPQLDQKIQLLQEVERLKQSLLETEQSKNKLLEKTKRHTLISIPDVVQDCEELRKLLDYIC